MKDLEVQAHIGLKLMYQRHQLHLQQYHEDHQTHQIKRHQLQVQEGHQMHQLDLVKTHYFQDQVNKVI